MIGPAGENIMYLVPTTEYAIVFWTVDPGITDHSHRKNLLNPSYRVVGFGCAPHKIYRNTFVAEFS